MKKAILCYLVFTVFNTDTFAASFDCSKASLPTEIAICSDSELSKLDDLMSSVYTKVHTRNPAIKSNQRDWVKETRLCSSSDDIVICLKEQYAKRLNILTQLVEANYSESTPDSGKQVHGVEKAISDVQLKQEHIIDKAVSTLNKVVKETGKANVDSSVGQDESANEVSAQSSIQSIVIAALLGGFVVYLLVKPKSKKEKNQHKNSNVKSLETSDDRISKPTDTEINDEIVITNYEHYLAADSNGTIRANVLYTSLPNGEVVGCYSGYAGGGVSDCRVIWLDDTWSNCIVTDDEYEFDQSLHPYFSALQKIRAEYEYWDDDNIELSEKGKEFINFDNSDESLIVNNTDDFEMDVILLAQEQWTLLYSVDFGNDTES